MKSGACPKCEGTSILANIGLMDHVQHGTSLDTKAAVSTTPNAMFFPTIVTSKIRAWVCESCGYAEFYVAEPAKLGKAIDRAITVSKGTHNPHRDPHRLS